jgi:hypothetical protein
MKLRFAVIVCLAAVIAQAPLAQAQDTLLRYRWSKGDQVRYRITQKSSVAMRGLPGLGDMTIDQDIVQVVRMIVDDVTPDGTATVRQIFESVRVEQNSIAGKVVFDSAAPVKTADPAADGLAAVMGGMIGESVTIVMLPTGAVTKVDGMSRIFDKVMKLLPADPIASLVFAQLKDSMGDEAMRSNLGQTFGLFPPRAVKMGESWTDQYQAETPILGTMTTVRTSTLKSLDTTSGASIARIGVALTIKQAGGAATPGLLGMTVKSPESSSDGEVLFDVTKGRLQKTSSTMDMPMTMSMPGLAEEMNARVRTASTTEVIE